MIVIFLPSRLGFLQRQEVCIFMSRLLRCLRTVNTVVVKQQDDSNLFPEHTLCSNRQTDTKLFCTFEHINVKNVSIISQTTFIYLHAISRRLMS